MTHDEYLEITRQYSTIFYFDDNLHLKESEETRYLLTGYDYNGMGVVYKIRKHPLQYDKYEFRTYTEFVLCSTQKELNDAIKEQIIRMKKLKLEDRIKSIEDDFVT